MTALPAKALKLVENAPRRKVWRFASDEPWETVIGSRFLSGCGQLEAGDVVFFTCGVPGHRHAALGQIARLHPDGQVSLSVRAHLFVNEGDG